MKSEPQGAKDTKQGLDRHRTRARIVGNESAIDTKKSMKDGEKILKMTTVNKQEMLKKAYTAFNSRDIETALSLMHSDVAWPDGINGGYVHGHDAVREYWRQQWAKFGVHVEPMAFKTLEDKRVSVEVHQTVRDLAGKVIADYMVQHIYTLEEGLVRTMEIRKL